MIEIRDVEFAYPGADGPRRALDGVSITVVPGEFVVVLGHNGSGKSTLARLMNGLLLPSAGEVVVDGMRTTDSARTWDIRARVGLVFQNPDNQIVGTSVEEDVAFGPENLGVDRGEIRRRVDEALVAVGLAGLERREPHMLSEGQKQRLAIAGVLALRPAYLVADEPTAMLDPASRAAVVGILRRTAAQGAGVVLITQDTAEAAAADRVLVMAEGRLVYDGPPRELFVDTEVASRLGVALPPLAALASALRARGIDAPILPTSAEGLVEAMWRS